MFEIDKTGLGNPISIKFFKRIIWSVIIILSAVFLGNWTSPKIVNYLLINDVQIESPLLYFLIGVIIACVIIIFSISLFKYKYRISFVQGIFFLFIISLYLNIKYSLQSQFVEVFPIWQNLNLFDVFLSIYFSFFFGTFLWRCWPKNPKKKNLFIEDNPIENKDTRSSNYLNLLKRIEPALLYDNYETAFSIGIVGPWGSGKSSFIKSIEKHIEVNQSKANFDILYFSFSPFLNHNEDQVINEFFTKLSNELKKRSGKLSNLIINYSGRLTNVIKDKNALSWLKPSPTSIEQKSTTELYIEIDKLIKQLDIKIIVSIDDLDRLNSKEILQVLKLIRNSSNFSNVVFLVALDKNYVIETLKNEKQYMEGKFIDKFFQYEIFLNSIEHSILTDTLSDWFEKFETQNPNLFVDLSSKFILKEILSEIKFDGSLFPLFIKNHRDLTKLYNVIVADWEFLKEYQSQIQIKDYINICFLKINYPKIYFQLSSEPWHFLELTDQKTYSLKANQKNPNEQNKDLINNISTPKILDFLLTEKEDYSFSKEFKYQTQILEYNEREFNLLFGLLYFLFSQSNPSDKAVMNVDVFERLFNVDSTNIHFTHVQFQELIEAKNWQKLKEIWNSNSKIDLIKRLKAYTPLSKQHQRNYGVFIINLYIEFDELYILELDRVFGGNAKLNLLESKEIVSFFQKNLFEKLDVNISKKMNVLKNIQDQNIIKLDFPQAKISSIAAKIFKSEIEKSEQTLVGISPIVSLYFDFVVPFPNSKKIIQNTFNNFLKINDNSILFAKLSIENDSNLDGSNLYRISERSIRVFSGIDNLQLFYDQINSIYNSENELINEFISFIEDVKSLPNQNYIIFNFKHLISPIVEFKLCDLFIKIIDENIEKHLITAIDSLILISSNIQENTDSTKTLFLRTKAGIESNLLNKIGNLIVTNRGKGVNAVFINPYKIENEKEIWDIKNKSNTILAQLVKVRY